MEKTIIDERSGWEYELKGEQYYPTGRVVKNGVMTPAEMPEDNAPEEDAISGNTKNRCISICLYPAS